MSCFQESSSSVIVSGDGGAEHPNGKNKEQMTHFTVIRQQGWGRQGGRRMVRRRNNEIDSGRHSVTVITYKSLPTRDPFEW